MHACGMVETSAESLLLRMPQDGSAHLLELHGSFVEHRLTGVVPQTVRHHQVEVCFQICHGAVLMSLQLLTHGSEVHGLRNKLQIIWNLRYRKKQATNFFYKQKFELLTDAVNIKFGFARLHRDHQDGFQTWINGARMSK